MAKKEENEILPFYLDSGYGFPVGGHQTLHIFKSALDYKPRSDDLFIVSYPKCGTTWTQCIVRCIFNEGKFFTSALDYLCNSPHLEMSGAEAAKTMKRPGAIKLHLPFDLTPWSPDAKYIYVTRNPKDCVVSSYHFIKNIPGYQFRTGKFDDFFELFMEGNVIYGDYFDHLLSWYKHRKDPNVLFLTYEDMNKDPKSIIFKIAEFMGESYKDKLITSEDMLNDVLKHTSFDFMKQTFSRQISELAASPKDVILNHPEIPEGLKKFLTKGDGYYNPDPNCANYARKGIVGDFRNYLSVGQNRRLEEKFREKTRGTDIPELWKDIM